MTKVKRLQETVTKLTARISEEEAKATEAQTKAGELDQRIADFILRAGAGESVDKELSQAKKDRSDSMFDHADHLKAAIALRAQLQETEDGLREAEKAAAATRYAELAQKRSEVDKRIEAATAEIIAAITELLAIDAQQRLEAKKAEIVTGRAAKPMIEDYITFKLKPLLKSLLPRVSQKGELSEIDRMSQ